MTIDKKYSSQIIDLTNKTEQTIRKVGFTKYNIHLLEKEIESLLAQLEDLSSRKDALISLISKLYGLGYLNPETWLFTPNGSSDQSV